jgi:hypothetical protein
LGRTNGGNLNPSREASAIRSSRAESVSGWMATDSNKSNTSTPKRVRLWKAYQFRKWGPEITYVSVRQKAWRHPNVRCNHAGPRAHELDRAISGNVPLHDSGRIVGYPEVISERHLLAGESDFSWEIPASHVKLRIAVRPSPVKSGGLNGSLQHSLRPFIDRVHKAYSVHEH